MARLGSLSAASAPVFAALLLSLVLQAQGHAFLSKPKARQVIWSDLDAPSGYERYPAGDVQSLSAGGPGTEKTDGHGLCGGLPEAPHYTKPGKFGPRSEWWYVEKTSNYTEGGVMDVEVTVTAHHKGWFELRLCDPPNGEPVTQECLNQHILKFDRQHAEELYGSMMEPGFRSPADYMQSLFDTQTYSWKHVSDCINHGSPEGSCCKPSGGPCSDPSNNDDRWVLPKTGSDGYGGNNNVYQIRYLLPTGLTCERCVVQLYYQTGNSVDGYPEGFWNCADIRIGPASGGGGGSTPAPTGPTTTPAPTTTSAPTASGIDTPQPTPSVTQKPTSSQRTCVSIQSHISDQWCQAVNCDPVYADFCQWDDKDGESTASPTTPSPTATTAPTTPSPTATPAPTTQSPTPLIPSTLAPTGSGITTESPTSSSTCTCISVDPRATNEWCQDTNCDATYVDAGFCAWECSGSVTTPAPTASETVTTSAPTTSGVFTAAPTTSQTTAAPTGSSPPPPPPPPPSGDFKLDIIGFHGNSGLAVEHIPLLKDVPCYYNVLIITFANFKSDGSMVLEMQGPYANDFEALKTDIQVWKAQTDPYGRERRVLFSIGGQNGHWPDGLTELQVKDSVFAFLDEYGFDGMDVDLEGDAVESASTLLPVIQAMREQGYSVVASPEAAQRPLNAYQPIIPYLDYYHPQFYNNPTNAVVEPYTPSQSGGWASPPSHWQDGTPSTYDVTSHYSGTPGQAWWLSVLDATSDNSGLEKHQRGMLVPAAVKAAGVNKAWEYDFDKLASTIAATGLTHVGTWALAYDNEIGWAFSKRMAQTMGALQC